MMLTAQATMFATLLTLPSWPVDACDRTLEVDEKMKKTHGDSPRRGMPHSGLMPTGAAGRLDRLELPAL
jgi:hypothetical protein